MQDYIEEFELALTQVTLPPEHSLSIFLAGLEHNTQMHVRMFNPTSIAQATNLAKLHEASKSNASKFYSRPGNSNSKPTTMNNKANDVSSPNFQNPASKPIFSKAPRTYSAAKMAERRAKGLCMFCDEPFAPGHQLKHKRSQMLVMEMDEEEPVDEEIEIIEENGTVQVINKQVESPQISLNALNGVHNYQTMRVSALHNKKMLQVLIDSGSTQFSGPGFS